MPAGARLRALLILAAVSACGGVLPVDGDDAGLDASNDATSDVAEASVDATTSDVVDAETDAGEASDAPLDVAEAEASCPVPLGTAPDASVDLDAATAPWTLITDQTVRYQGLAIDSTGRVIAVGSTISNSAAFIVQTANESSDAGWSKSAGSGSAATGVSTDVAGYVYVTGYTQSPLDLGGGALGPGAFVVKYDSAGTFVWEYGPFNGATFSSVRVKSTGAVVIGGSLGGTVDFGGGKRTNVGDTDALLVEVTSCGDYVRDAQWGDSGGQEIDAVALDSSDAIFVGGRFYGAIDFGGGPMTGPSNSSNFSLFIAKLDANDGYLHQLNANGYGNNNYVEGLVTDANGNVAVAGTQAGTIDWGGGALVPFGIDDVYVAKLDGSLGHLWSHTYGEGQNSTTAGYALVGDPLGGVVVTGFYGGNAGTLDFGQGALPSSTQFGGEFFAWFDSSGVSTASLGIANTNGSITPLALGFASWPDIIVAGQCAGSVTLPSGSYPCYGGGSGFIARLTP